MILALGLTALGFGQEVPWIPPTTSLPSDFVQTVRFLHAHGLSDPRGGEFRRVKIHRGALTFPTGRGFYNELIGWVLPEKKGEPRRVVTLNGLTYPVREVGEPVDLDAVLKRDGSLFAEYQNPFLVAALLLLRGDSARAERVYLTRSQGVFPTQAQGGDPANFWATANTFLYAWWNQALSAHSAGDPKGALQVASRISQFRDDFETEGRRRGLVKAGETFAFPTLKSLPSLLVDARRRVQEGDTPIDLDAVKKLPAPARIKALIEALDDATAFVMSDAVSFQSDPVVKALADEGDAALPALFEAVEHDPRLTRVVAGWRMQFQDRELIPVSRAATAAIQEILHARTLDDLERLKAFWLQTRDLGPVNRQILVLEDDKAGWQRWLEATEAIFRRSDVRLPVARRVALTEILNKRVREIATPSTPSWKLRAALIIARAGVHLDPKAGQALGDEVLQVAFDRFQSQPDDLDHAGAALGNLVQSMVQAGNVAILDRYLAALESRRAPAGFDGNSKQFFAPLLDSKKRPNVQAAAEHTFLGDTSSWSIPRVAKERFGSLSPLIDREMLSLSPVQRGLLKVLDDHSLLGDLEVVGPNYVSFISRKGQNTASFPIADPNLPSIGDRTPMRVADALMVDLSRLRGAPAFAPTWPESRRDESIEAMKRFLREKAAILPSLVHG